MVWYLRSEGGAAVPRYPRSFEVGGEKGGARQGGGEGCQDGWDLGRGGRERGAPVCVCVPLPLGGSVAWRLYDVKPQRALTISIVFRRPAVTWVVCSS